MFFYILFATIAFYCILYLFDNSSLSVYLDNRGRKIIALLYLHSLKRSQKPVYNYRLDVKDVYKVGALATKDERILEHPRPLSNDLYAGDTVEFWGIDNKGNALAVHLTRRHDRRVDMWIYLKLNSGEEYQSTIHPDVRIYNTDGKTFSAGGLTLEPSEAMRRWRIIYRGVLRKGINKTWDPENRDEVKVCMNFVWHAGYQPFALRQHFHVNALADAISKSPISLFDLPKYNFDPDERTEQWGQMTGEVLIDHNDGIKIDLWGPKVRSHGIQNWKNISKRLRLHMHTKGGTVLSLCADDEIKDIHKIINGYVVPASNFNLNVISKTNLDIVRAFFNISNNEPMHIKLNAGNKTHSLSFKVQSNGFKVYGGEDWESKISTKLIEGTYDGEPMVGFVEISQRYYDHSPLASRKSLPCVLDTRIPLLTECKNHVVKLTDDICRNGDLVGGKASSLAFLMTLKEQGNFKVPLGICVTNNAYTNFISKRTSILNAIIRLESIAWQKTKGNIQTHCQTVVDAITKSTFPFETRDFIHEQLQQTFGNDYELQKLFAVRSSAIGEDGEEASEAGQNDTFLGVLGLDEVCNAVIKCWASQFSFRSVEYKRKNGQLLNAGMAVVIQQMIPSDVSGVIFTNDPVTGSYGYVTITSNYGLGESVVSGASDPDTIVLRRAWDDSLTVLKTDIGKKNMKIILKDDGGTEEQNTDLIDASKCTLKEQAALKLGKVAIFLENSYGTPRDIEWAMYKRKIYLLQCRPVTTHLQETKYEILHEFDGCRITDNERYTTANVAEVLPGATSPLASSLILRVFFICGHRLIEYSVKDFQYNPLINSSLGSMVYMNHFLQDQIFQKLFGLSEKGSAMLYAMQLGVYGRIVDDSDIHQLALKRFPIQTSWYNFKMFYALFLKSVLRGNSALDEIQPRFQNYEVPMDGISNAEDLYKRIEYHLFDMDDMLLPHIRVSTASMVWNFVILHLLGGSNKEFSIDHYNDFANVIGKSNGALSGDVPFGLQELAKTIAEENKNAFSTMSPEVALNWLEISNNQSSAKFKEFLQRHGHRGYKELEISSVPWKRDPIKIVNVLQPMVASYGTRKENNTRISEDIFKDLKTPLSFIQKKILKYVQAKSRIAVNYREKAKSLVVKSVDGMRNAYLKLGEMLMNEGKLPDENLIFFLTHDEIGQVLNARSARILNRANHRKRLFPYMDSIQFPEFIVGEPKYEDEADGNPSSNGVMGEQTKMSAYPVSQGTVKGPARVVLKFSEVDQIQPGDILITHATDIAWSPYFPMLGGVVTEIGGLVSHGAVVAREYGLPCIVGADGATKIFKSGEIVFLNATKGTIEKVL